MKLHTGPRPPSTLTAFGLAFALAAPTLFAGPAASNVEIFPVEDLRPGMRAVGRTVFEGELVEEFEVEILGVMKNAISPRRDIIFARLVGERVEYTGVASGMSGSPVFIDGKLLGALSYRFGAFSKEPIGGITPISYMLSLDGAAQATPDAGGLPGGIPLGTPTSARKGATRASAAWMESYQDLAQNHRKSDWNPTAKLTSRSPASVGSSTFLPIGVPVSFNGFGPEALAEASQAFAGMGFVPVSGQGMSSGLPVNVGLPMVEGEGEVTERDLPAALEPGSAVAVQLIRGDMDVTATGTVTWVDGDEVYAFGHQFYNFGRVSLPMASANVIRILASPAGSFKISSVGEPLGSFSQDRVTGIFGKMGTHADMVPVHIDFTDGESFPMGFDFEIAGDPLLAPLLLRYSLQNVFQAADKEFGEKTLSVKGSIAVEGQDEVSVENFFSGATAYAFASSYVAGYLNLLYGNDFTQPHISAVNLQVQASDDVRMAEVASLVPSAYSVEPGGTIRLRIGLQPRRGEPVTVDCEITVPVDAPVGTANLYVGDAETLGAQDVGPGDPPRSMQDVIALLNGLRRDNHLYASLSTREGGISVNGQSFGSLPGSGLAILAVDQGAAKESLPAAELAASEVPTTYTILGHRQLAIRIVPPTSS